MISYSLALQRHAMHLIRVNYQESMKDKNAINFQDNFYMLDSKILSKLIIKEFFENN